MKNLFVLLLTFSLFHFSCEKKLPPTPKDLLKENLIPLPVEMKATGSSFRLTKKTKISVASGNDEMKRVGEYLANLLRPATGFELPIIEGGNSEGNISLELQKPAKGKESYNLIISENGVKIQGDKEGIFRGIQTLRQLFSEKIEMNNVQNDTWEIATGNE